MELRFNLDAETAQPHMYAHGVTEVEVQQVLTRPVENRRGREDSWVAVGQTATGRTLRVIYVPDAGADSAFIITAYDLRGKPLKALRRRQRRKPR